MADFDAAFNETMSVEGTYSNDPVDPGGETYKGIARKKHSTWKGWDIVDELKGEPGFPKNLDGTKELQECVKDFYKIVFWDHLYGDAIPSDEIGIELFDTAVNMGIHWASTFLQRTLNVLNRNEKLYPDIIVDGAIGPGTIEALNTLLETDSPDLVLLWLNVLQGARYIEIMEANPSLEKYARGWAKRISLSKQY